MLDDQVGPAWMDRLTDRYTAGCIHARSPSSSQLSPLSTPLPAMDGNHCPDPLRASQPLQGKAEVLALAKRMLRRRDKESIVDAAYNRYAFHDAGLPRWFAEDEQRFMRCGPAGRAGGRRPCRRAGALGICGGAFAVLAGVSCCLGHPHVLCRAGSSALSRGLRRLLKARPLFPRYAHMSRRAGP
jgi:hypothetical protein